MAGEGERVQDFLSPIAGRPRPGQLLPESSNRRRALRAATRRIVYSSADEQEVPVESSKKNMKWRGQPQRTFRYVDDNLQVTMLNMETAVPYEDPPGVKKRTKHSVQCQNSFRSVVRRSEERGMRVNESKTAMICISGAQSYAAEAYIEDASGKRIATGDKMKVLGFHLSSRPGGPRPH